MNRIKAHKMGTSVAVIGAIILVIVLNIFMGILASKFSVKIDLTSNKLYGLSEKTTEYLKNYNTPTTIYVLASEAEQDDRVRSVLNQYAALNSCIEVKNINMKENPTFGMSYVKSDESLSTNSIIVDSGKRFKLFTRSQLVIADEKSPDALNVENEVTSALRYVSSEKSFKAAFSKGHGESELKGAMQKLQSENYEVGEVNMLAEDIQKDISLLMIVNPTADFSESEITKLDNYMSNGGNLQVYFNIGNQNLPNLYRYLESWGIGVNNDVVAETDENQLLIISGNGQRLIMPVIEDTEFTHSLIEKKRSLAYLPYSKSLTQKFEINGTIKTMPILTSTEKTHLSNNYEDVSQSNGSPEGKYAVGMLAEDSKTNSSVYVSGNTALLQIEEKTLSNNYNLANYDYFMNLVNYTLDNDEGFTVNKKTILDGSIVISQTQSNVVRVIVIIIIPLVVLLIGLAVWFKRRNL